jgi:hypothetical protein
MPNIYYYCQSGKRGRGMLRAVMSMEEGKCFLKLNASHYIGQEFPATDVNSAPDFAILRVLDEETTEEYPVGFYRFDADIERIEEAVRACTTKLSNLAEEQAASTESRHPR